MKEMGKPRRTHGLGTDERRDHQLEQRLDWCVGKKPALGLSADSIAVDRAEPGPSLFRRHLQGPACTQRTWLSLA